MFTFETSDPKEARRFRIAQFNGRTATARAAGSAITGHVRSIVENKARVPAAWVIVAISPPAMAAMNGSSRSRTGCAIRAPRTSSRVPC